MHMLVEKFASFLQFSVDYNNQSIREITHDESVFCSAEELDDVIPIHDYLVRIYELIGCEGEHYVIAPFAYICRLQTTHVFRLTRRNVHRMALTAIVVTCKMYDDFYAPNSYYAAVGGVDVEELQQQELRFLVAIQWRVFLRQDNLKLALC